MGASKETQIHSIGYDTEMRKNTNLFYQRMKIAEAKVKELEEEIKRLKQNV